MQALIKEYENYLLLEKALAKNSIEAYKQDVLKLVDFADSLAKQVLELSLSDLELFVKELRELGIGARSQARIVSGVKSFYQFLELNKYLELNPSDLLESPKIGFKIPEVLSLDEINAVLGSIDLSLPEGQRNKAMLEVLYSCGLRVSELTGLRFADLYLDDGFIKVLGKGGKQRLVPISPVACKEIRLYLPDRAAINVKKGHEDILFLSRRGTALSRIMIFHIVKQHTQLAGVKKIVSPHTFRHSFATHLLEGGANLRVIQKMLGHERITTTEIYTHIDREYLRIEILEHHPRNKKRNQ